MCVVHVFILFVVAQNAVWKNVLEKENKKEIEKKRKREALPVGLAAQPAPGFPPQRAAQETPEAQQQAAVRLSPLSWSLAAGPSSPSLAAMRDPPVSLLSHFPSSSPPGRALGSFLADSNPDPTISLPFSWN